MKFYPGERVRVTGSTMMGPEHLRQWIDLEFFVLDPSDPKVTKQVKAFYQQGSNVILEPVLPRPDTRNYDLLVWPITGLRGDAPTKAEVAEAIESIKRTARETS